MGAYLVFVDETGFLLIPTVLRTWAPRGQTPVHRHRYERDKISVISGLSVIPQRQRLGLYFRLHPRRNIGQAEVCEFLRYLLRHLRGPVIVLLDNSATHKGAPLRALCQRHPRLHVEYFPAYAPELNPDEAAWSLAKRALVNGRLRRSVARCRRGPGGAGRVAGEAARVHRAIRASPFFDQSIAFFLLWSIIRRVYEFTPLFCRECGGEMRIVAFFSPQAQNAGEAVGDD